MSTECETQPLGIMSYGSIDDSHQSLKADQLHEHLVRKGVQLDSDQVGTVRSAVRTLGQNIRQCDLEDDDALNSRLAKAAETISDFLKLAALTISTEESYAMLPLGMRGQLVDSLDLILCESFLQTLFCLRQNIRSMAIKREHFVSSQIATLPDVVIAAIIDYVSGSTYPEESLKVKTSVVREYSTIELTVRLPHRIDSLAHFLASPIPETEQDLALQLKLKALALLYCSHCLNPSSGKPSGNNLVDCLSGFCLYVQLEKLHHPSIIHMLCVYMSSYSTSKDELHPFRPATNSILWTLLLKVFPDPYFLSEEKINHSQRILFSHGALMMPWIWHNNALCPAEESDWTVRITLMWLHQNYLVFKSNFMKYENASFDDIFYGFQRLKETSDSLAVKTTLLGNNQNGLKVLLNIVESIKIKNSYGIENNFSGYIILIVLHIYSDLCDSQHLVTIPSQNDEICGTIQKILQAQIEWTLEEQAPPGLEILGFTLMLSKSMCARMLQTLELNLGRLLDGILLTIEISADPSRSKEQSFADQVSAFTKLKFLAKWVQICSSEKFLDIPLTCLINLVNMLLKPLRCGNKIALAIAELVFCISKSMKEKWTLNCKQLQIFSDAMTEVMMAEDETLRHEAGLLAANFAKEFGSRFDHSMNYPTEMFRNLAEQLSDLLWRHWFTLDNHEEKLLDFKKQSDRLSTATNVLSVTSLAEAIYILFNQLEEIQRKYLQASPLTLDLVIGLKSEVFENEEMIQNLIQTLLVH